MGNALVLSGKSKLFWVLLAGLSVTGVTALAVTLVAVRSPAKRNAELQGRVDRLEALLADGGNNPRGAVPRLTVPAADVDTIASLTERIATLETQVVNLRGQGGAGGAATWQELAASPNPELRQLAIRRLRDLARNDPAARKELARLLRDGDSGVRRSALNALRQLGDPAFLGDVVGLLADGDPGTRGRAARVAGDLAKQSKDPAERSRAAQGLQGLLNDAETDVRRDAVRGLGEIGGKEAVPALLSALRDSSFEVQERAIEGLGDSGDPAALPALRQAYGDGSGPNALEAAVALKQLGDAAPFAHEATRLRALLAHEGSPDEKSEAIGLLAEHAPQESRAAIEKALRDPSERVRREAQRALEKSRH